MSARENPVSSKMKMVDRTQMYVESTLTMSKGKTEKFEAANLLARER